MDNADSRIEVSHVSRQYKGVKRCSAVCSKNSKRPSCIWPGLKEQIALFNDNPLPSVVKRLGTLPNGQDSLYLRLPSTSMGRGGVRIDFDEFSDVYFWDTDFLTAAQMFSDLTPEGKQQLGFTAEVFGVTHGSALHLDELLLKRWHEGRADPPLMWR